MLINNKYKLETNPLNFILFHKTDKAHRSANKEIKEDTWNPEAYFSTLSNAVHYLVEQGIMDTAFKDFKTVVKKQEELHKLVEDLCPKLFAIDARKDI